jgi:hypothetical protein
MVQFQFFDSSDMKSLHFEYPDLLLDFIYISTKETEPSFRLLGMD